MKIFRRGDGRWRSDSCKGEVASRTRSALSVLAALPLSALALVVIPPTVAGAEGLSQATVTKLSAPSDAASDPKGGTGSVSCTSPGNCVAGGAYIDSSGKTQVMLAVETNGAWAQATKLSPPSDAGNDPQDASTGVYCNSVGNCLVVGYYNDSSGRGQAMQATETNGTWGQATKLSAPADAGANPQVHPENLSCTSAGNCTWVGYYADSSGNRQAMQATETNGIWGQGTKVSAPADAAINPKAALWDVSCTSAGNCVGVGYYIDSTSKQQAMQATETNGTWAQPTTVAAPAITITK
jgi:hypothetical protein